jgi:hypothetical protein
VPVEVVGLVDPGREPWLQRHTAIGALAGGFFAGPQLPMLDGPRPLPAEWGVRIRDDASGWPETRAALRAFRAVADSVGAKPLVLVIPDKAQIDPAARTLAAAAIGDPAYDPQRPYRGMIAAAEAAGLPVVDPLAALVAAADGDTRALYFGKDWHTTAIGNRVLADQVARALRSPALLGPAPRAAAPLSLADAAAAGVAGGWLRITVIVAAIWLTLGTLYWQRFPAEGVARSYASVAAIIGSVVAIFVGVDWIVWFLPPWLSHLRATSLFSCLA